MLFRYSGAQAPQGLGVFALGIRPVRYEEQKENKGEEVEEERRKRGRRERERKREFNPFVCARKCKAE
jgi:hypothetical protein